MRSFIFKGMLLLAIILNVSPLLAQDLDEKLFNAVKDDYLEEVKNLIEQGANPNAVDADSIPLLMWAVYKSDLDMVKYLVDHGADVRKKGLLTDTVKHVVYGSALVVAAGEGKFEILKYFIEKCGINPNDRELIENGKEEGWSALHYIPYVYDEDRQIEMADYLLQKGANINQQAVVDGNTPLHIAAYNGRLRLVKWLVAHGANINALDKQNAYPLNAAFYNEYDEVVRYLYEEGTAWPALLFAALSNNLSRVQSFVQQGQNVNVTDKVGLTPLHIAASVGNYEIVGYLLKKGAQVNLKNNDGWTALHYAARNGRTKILGELLDAGANPNVQTKQGWTPIKLAVVNQNIVEFELLLCAGADPLIRDNKGLSAIDDAKQQGHKDILEIYKNYHCDDYLQQAKFGYFSQIFKHIDKIDVNEKDGDGCTLLHRAVEYGNLKLVKLLILNKADINEKDNFKISVLSYSILSDNSKIVEYLIKHGSKINESDGSGWTPLILAIYNGKVDIVKLLIKYGANVNAKDNFPVEYIEKITALKAQKNLRMPWVPGWNTFENMIKNMEWENFFKKMNLWNSDFIEKLAVIKLNIIFKNLQKELGMTPLMYAILSPSHKRMDIIKLLVKHGADINGKDNNGLTPLMYASCKGSVDIVKFLIEHGARKNVRDDRGLSAQFYAFFFGNLEIVKYLQ